MSEIVSEIAAAPVFPSAAVPPFGTFLRVFARIGCLSFGGPAGQIALMHRELVDERRWVSEPEFLHALNFCHLLPGPEAQQLATWIGWKLHGTRGGIVAGSLFVVPGALVMLALSAAYASAAGLAWFSALFLGIKAAILAVVAQALLRVAGRALGTPLRRGIAAAAFAALFLFDAPFPLVVIAAAIAGAFGARAQVHGDIPDAPAPPVGPALRQSLRAVTVWGAVWAAPMLAVLVTLGRDHVLWRIGVFFSTLAVVTFGGAYAVLAYMAQQAVSAMHWLSAGEMADGLGLAETTPGPLILVTQFVGTLAAARAPAPFTPLVAGLLGAGLTVWVTFAPCFLWIFAFAPWIERLRASRRLANALGGITAGVVGVIANLAAWFALHVLFARVDKVAIGPLTLHAPQWTSFDWRAALLAALAALLVFRLRWGLIRVLALAAAGGLVLGLMVPA